MKFKFSEKPPNNIGGFFIREIVVAEFAVSRHFANSARSGCAGEETGPTGAATNKYNDFYLTIYFSVLSPAYTQNDSETPW